MAKKVEFADPESGPHKVSVTARADRRCRAGECFSRDARQLEVSDSMLEMLKTDPLLVVAMLDVE